MDRATERKVRTRLKRHNRYSIRGRPQFLHRHRRTRRIEKTISVSVVVRQQQWLTPAARQRPTRRHLEVLDGDLFKRQRQVRAGGRLRQCRIAGWTFPFQCDARVKIRQGPREIDANAEFRTYAERIKDICVETCIDTQIESEAKDTKPALSMQP